MQQHDSLLRGYHPYEGSIMENGPQSHKGSHNRVVVGAFVVAGMHMLYIYIYTYIHVYVENGPQSHKDSHNWVVVGAFVVAGLYMLYIYIYI